MRSPLDESELPEISLYRRIIEMAENPDGATRAEDIVLSLSDKFAATANAKSVFGDPVTVGNRTIVPVARFGYVLGATSGGRNGETVGGGGGGGGVGARPIGYIEITDEATRYVEFSAVKKLIVAAALGFMAGYLLSGRKSRI
jgi:uncharacterized spore protein YtfJ